MHRVRTVKIRPRTRAAAEGLVVTPALAPEGQVVHRALRGRHQAESAENDVGDSLRGFHIAADHRRARCRVGAGPRVEKAEGNVEPEGHEHAFVQRDLLRDQASKTVDDSCLDDGQIRVQVALYRRGRAAEVELSGVAPHPQLQLNPRAVVKLVDEVVVIVGQRPQSAAHLRFRRVLDVLHVRQRLPGAE